MEKVLRVYVINLDRSKDRLARFDENMRALGVPYERWAAVDGSKVKRAPSNATFFCRYFSCSGGVIGCYASHVSLWKHISESPDGWYMVLEDDALLTRDAIENLAGVFADLERWDDQRMYPDMINLHCEIFCRYRKITDHIYETPIVQGTAAYLVSKRGAERLYHLMNKPIAGHVDLTLSIKQVANKTIGYYSTKNLVSTAGEASASTISSKTIPTIESALACAAVRFFGLSDHACAAFYSSMLVTGHIKMNVFIFVSVLVVASLLRYRRYALAASYALAQAAHYLLAP